MAAGLFRHAVGDSYNVLSAGLAAVEGQPASQPAVEVMAELGIDISGHRSRMISEELVRQADYIFAMTRGQVEALIATFPEAREKTFLLREFNDELEEFEKDVPDPIGGSQEVYRLCRDKIQQGITGILRYFEQMGEGGKLHNKLNVLRVAIGADHGGFDLKEQLKQHLVKSNVVVLDFGTSSKESVDYPDIALPVCQAVVSGSCNYGILICTTGIGMSIAANKIPGIRAALCWNEHLAEMARRHNNANVLCLSGSETSFEQAQKIVEIFLNTPFDGGRHERRVCKFRPGAGLVELPLRAVDPAMWQAIEAERRRQSENLELIASENFTSIAVLEAQGSVLTNKYAEGYPNKRWYGGCENIDVIEQLAIDRAKSLFKAEHANVQPHSGSQANMAVYFAVLKPGDKILTMDLTHGGHLTHGNRANFSGKLFEVIHYGVRKEDEQIDYEELERLAHEYRPKMITVGASAYPRIIDFERIAKIARSVGAYLLADIAHIAGLVVAGLHPSPVPCADFVTTTTHKTLRGPRGGLILCKAQYVKEIDSTVFPGVQGGPLEHVIAAKAVCFLQAMHPSFKAYQEQVVKNAKALAEALKRHGFRLVSGGTDNHLILVDVGIRGLTGRECQEALDDAGITVNKNTIPFETRSPFQASGIRLGTPAVTTRGMKEGEMEIIADLIAKVLRDPKDVSVRAMVRQKVRQLTRAFPLPY